MLSLLVVALLAQTPPPVVVQDPNSTTKAKVVTTSGGALQVSCVGGTCSAGGGAAQWTIVDGGVVQIWDGVDKAQVTATAGGALQVECVGGTCGSAAPFADSSAFSFGTTSVVNSGGVVDDVATNTVAENSAGAPRITAQRGLHVNLRNVSGTEVGTAGAPLRVDPTGTTPQPVSGTVTTSPPSNASTNVAQFGGNAVATGTGAGGVGIPRVTISSDSSLAANQSVNVAQINGVTPLMGVGASGTGAQRTASLIHDGTTVAGVIVATTALKTDTSSVAGTATSTAAAGVQKVGVVGNTGAAVDGVITAAASPANMVVTGGVFNTALPTLTNGQSSALQFNSKGMPLTQLGDGTTSVAVIAGTTALKTDTSSIAGTATSTGVGASGAGVQRVASLIHDGTTTAGVIVATTALKTDLSSVAGTATATGNGTAAGSIRVSVASDSTGTIAATQSGTWTDRVVGNAGAAFDAVNNAAAPANVIAEGWETVASGSQPSAATGGNMRRPMAGTDGVPFARLGGPVSWSCGLTAIAATLTQCQAAPAAGLRLYVTDIAAVSDTTTAGQFTLRFGTGSNCGTGTTTLFPNVSSISTGKWPYPANTANTPTYLNFQTPIAVTAANAVCIICVATNTCTVTINGYTAP